MLRFLKHRYALVFAFLLLPTHLNAESVHRLKALSSMSLSDLLSLKVTSVSRRAEDYQRAAAAVEVLTGEDLRRTGAINLPDALRYATGLQVSRISGGGWAISSRGFATGLSNKMEVRIDGRSVYSPLFSGVFWDVTDLLIEDVERVEIVRGPAAPMWGSNAVNGVINVTTKHARDSLGGFIVAGGGSEDRGFSSARYGTAVGSSSHLRTYVKHYRKDDLELADGTPLHDETDMSRAGLRFDTDFSDREQLTVRGDFYYGNLGSTVRDDTEVEGGSLTSRFSETVSDNHDISLLLAYSRSERQVPGAFSEIRDTYDVELEHRYQLSELHHLTLGGGYRISADETGENRTLRFDPEDRTVHLQRIFILDELRLLPDRLSVFLGTTVEHNDYTGVEVQPTLRAAFYEDTTTYWAALSRAVRTPSRLEDDIRVVPQGSSSPVAVGQRGFDAEQAYVAEVGVRAFPSTSLSLDATFFAAQYDELRTTEPSPNGGPLVVANKLEASTYGAEFAMTYSPLDSLRLKLGYTYVDVDYTFEPNSADSTGGSLVGNSAPHIGFLRMSYDLSDSWQLDTLLRYQDTLPDPVVSQFMELDVRLAWRIAPQVELTVVGRDLLHESHAEFSSAHLARSVLAQVRVDF